MATVLLLIICLGFVGLGIPDSIFGASWPAIYTELKFPIHSASLVTTITTFGTFVSSLFSARVINKFGVNRVAAVSTVLTAVSLFLFAYSSNIFFFCLLAFPLGLGGGAVDSGLNNYVALHYKESHMNYLHSFYGIGISVTPYVLSFLIKGGSGWRGGYRIMAIAQLVIALVLFVSFPLWKKSEGEGEVKSKTLGFKEMMRISALPFSWITFFASCSLEFTAGVWASTFLVDHIGVDPSYAAKLITLYYIGITVGRAFAGIISKRFNGFKLVFLGIAEVIIAVILLFIVKEPIAISLALFLIGFGNGPIYPALMYLTPRIYGESVSQSVMSSQMSAACLGVMLAPAIFGLVIKAFGVGAYPVYLFACVLLLVVATGGVISTLKNKDGSVFKCWE